MRVVPDGTTAEDTIRERITDLEGQIGHARERARAYDRMAAEERADVVAMGKLRRDLERVLLLAEDGTPTAERAKGGAVINRGFRVTPPASGDIGYVPQASR